jgi:enoyl-CoA hydratase/carnithine racemase
MICGRTLNAEEALSAGLVSRVFNNDDLVKESLSVAEQVANLGPNSVKLSKQLIRGVNKEPVEAQMQREGILFAQQLASQEFKESVKDFFEKCTPKLD